MLLKSWQNTGVKNEQSWKDLLEGLIAELEGFLRCCYNIMKNREKMVPDVGIELTTYRLQGGCSTTELIRHEGNGKRRVF